MYKIAINNKYNFKVEAGNDGYKVNGLPVDADIIPVGSTGFHILYKNRSFLADVVKFNKAEKSCIIKIGGNIYDISLEDKFDELLHQLGLDQLVSNKVNDVKAPMPGLVLNVMVKEGQEVKKGDSLFVLEAMKMENIIKAQSDAIIKSLKIKAGDKVEKSQALILFG